MRKLSAVSCAVVLALSVASIASASDALYFEKAAVKTASEATCLRFAGDVARNQSFRNPHKNASEVAGEKDGAYVSITCVCWAAASSQPSPWSWSSPRSSIAPSRVGSFVAGRMKLITRIDSPC